MAAAHNSISLQRIHFCGKPQATRTSEVWGRGNLVGAKIFSQSKLAEILPAKLNDTLGARGFHFYGEADIVKELRAIS